MNIHEYQAKELLKARGVQVLKGRVAYTAEEAVEVAKTLPGPVYVVKAQIHAGGRGKGGGVKVVKSLDEVKEASKKMIGMQLVTKQTGPQGQEVRRVFIEEGCEIARELYLGILIDRSTSRVTVMSSTEGGMDIEEVAAKHPEKILKTVVDPAIGLQPFQGREIAFGLGLEGKQVGKCAELVMNLYRAFIELDASIIEINPLVVTKQGDVLLLDAKMNFDDNGLFRQKEVEQLRDVAEEDPAEKRAKDSELNYVKLTGNIGCMVNGAGLAMATMDIIKLYGGDPANFLDVGGGATKERVAEAFRIILSDPNVEGILVNIFGGIMRCDVIAEGIITAAKELGMTMPLVVRLEGTNVDKGKKILKESGLHIIAAENLADAAQKVVNKVKAEAA
ncbi:MAG: ADP-forming succinate--CoA ligase subunit beta [Alphaproteobacteria bacterium]|nr:MAG: ADP-forming succinate--CoA ligase subunit beta [Alphaproteobacteria bacterium]